MANEENFLKENMKKNDLDLLKGFWSSGSSEKSSPGSLNSISIESNKEAQPNLNDESPKPLEIKSAPSGVDLLNDDLPSSKSPEEKSLDTTFDFTKDSTIADLKNSKKIARYLLVFKKFNK